MARAVMAAMSASDANHAAPDRQQTLSADTMFLVD